MLTSAQAERLSVETYRQSSSHLENCCLRISADVSYGQACDDVSDLTGMQVPAKTQQRLVHSHDFAQPELSELEEISVDGHNGRYQQNDDLAAGVSSSRWQSR